MEFLQIKQGRELLKYQNELFYEHRRGKRLPVITWRCKHNIQGCRASLKTLHGELIGNANAIHSHETSNHEFTSSNAGNKDIHDDVIHELLNLIKERSPILNHLAKSLNNPNKANNWTAMTTTNRMTTPASSYLPSSGRMIKSTNTESSESSEENPSSDEDQTDNCQLPSSKKKINRPCPYVKTNSKSTKPIKWEKW